MFERATYIIGWIGKSNLNSSVARVIGHCNWFILLIKR